MSSQPLDQQKLDKIAEQFSREMRQGNRPSVDAYVARYPDASGQLHQLLTSIAMIEGLKQASDDSGSTVAQHHLSIDQLDGYRIVREIGRGGMGIVFEAIDQSLNRQVAIKVLPNTLLSEARHLDRFRREAKAAARLRHPNIVSVFGVGQADQHHYYVMDCIEGVNLRQWLEKVTGLSADLVPTRDAAIGDSENIVSLHSSKETSAVGQPPTSIHENHPTETDTAAYFRWVAGIGVMLSDALQYAHSQGTLHRDIKPANLLLDHDGNVSITDFGLAKVAEQQPVTRTGDIVGTPQYMPPESFDGQYDAKSEIYALGLTLFELLALRPAISGKNHGELIRNASQGVAIAPRQFNANVPRDLETIVLKSLSVDPASRYTSAAKLCEDLRCFLGDLPISARRSSPIQRARRWARREPAAASLTLATFASLLALAIVATSAYFHTKSALSKTERSGRETKAALEQRGVALDSAETQRARAEANLSVAIEAFDQIREKIWQRGMLPDAEILGEVAETSSGDVSRADAEVLQSLLGFFDALAANNNDNLLAQSAAAGHRAGDIYQRLGQLAEANQAYSDALERYQLLAKENPDDFELVIQQARILNEQIISHSLLGQIPRASTVFDQTVRLLESSEAAMSSADGRFEYARSHALFASMIARAGIDESTTRRIRYGGRLPRRPGMTQLAERSKDEIVAIIVAIDILSKLTKEFPEETKYRVALARAYRDQSKVAARANVPGESARAIRESIELFDAILADNRDSDSIRYELAKTLSSSEASGLNQMRRILRADSLSNSLLEQDPSLPRYQALRAHVLETLSLYQHRAGKAELAEDHLNDAISLYDALIEASPDLILYKTKKSQALEQFADQKLRDGDPQSAIKYLERAIQEIQPEGRFANTSPVARLQLQKQRQKLNRIQGQIESL